MALDDVMSQGLRLCATTRGFGPQYEWGGKFGPCYSWRISGFDLHFSELFHFAWSDFQNYSLCRYNVLYHWYDLANWAQVMNEVVHLAHGKNEVVHYVMCYLHLYCIIQNDVDRHTQLIINFIDLGQTHHTGRMHYGHGPNSP